MSIAPLHDELLYGGYHCTDGAAGIIIIKHCHFQKQAMSAKKTLLTSASAVT